MGSSTSKPETKVFTPDTPIDFSATFLSQLETSPEVCNHQHQCQIIGYFFFF